MRRTFVRMVRPAAVMLAAAAAAFGSVLPAAADITAGSVQVTNPDANQVIRGRYNGDSATGFDVVLGGRATTTCSSGEPRWQSISFRITGPASYDETFAVSTTGAPSTWSDATAASWDTQPLPNGTYSVTLTVRERQSTLGFNCNGGTATSPAVPVKLANQAEAPQWESSPAVASDGSSITLQWRRNGEDDVLEYHIIRTGPDGTKVAPISASSPSDAPGCSVSANVYRCVDTAFTGPGTYNYELVAARERPAYNENEENRVTCATENRPCVLSQGSSIRSATIAAPTPDPTPSDPNTPAPTSPPTSRGGTTRNQSTTRTPASSGGGSGGGGGGGFFSGSFSSTLPYQPRTLILGGSASTAPNGQGFEGDVVSQTPPDYRTIMLPVAGGLLAFLSAAHVRRLLLHL